jgi:serine/threonine-protein kinase
MNPVTGSQESSADSRIGTVLSERYRIDALLGEGGMGKVYAAEHVLMKKRLAVKVLHRELTLVPEVVARFEREAMAAANIDHANVAAATDFGRLADGAVFLVLEFVQGRSLREEIGLGPMPVERAVHIARQIGAALRGAHAHGIVHRDLKPENVMLVEREGDPDFVKVLDFGVAKVPLAEVPSAGASSISRAGMVFGTPEYMAPEQALGEAVDGRADLYALGVMLYEMLAGVRPFHSESPVGILGQQLSQSPPAFVDRVGPGVVPPMVERVVLRLLARDKNQRPKTAREVEDGLSALLVPSAGGSGTRFTLAVGSHAPSLDPEPVQPSSISEHGSRPGGAPWSSPVSEPTAKGLKIVLEWWASLSTRVEVLRERLPSGLRDSLRPVPPRALAAAGVIGVGTVGVLGLSLLVVIGRSLFANTEPPEEAPLAVRTALPAPEISAAVAPPPPVQSAHSSRPASAGATEGETLSLAALAESRKKNHASALALATRALSIEPGLATDDRLSTAVFFAAREPATSNKAFALIEGPMGARGAELSWDLALDRKAAPAAQHRAARWLRSPNFRSLAPPALLLAADLRTAESCERARDLLPRAREIGDERSLSQLEAWQVRTGCGKDRQRDCMPCLRADVRLEEAIAAIRARPIPPWKSP